MSRGLAIGKHTAHSITVTIDFEVWCGDMEDEVLCMKCFNTQYTNVNLLSFLSEKVTATKIQLSS